jgi:hypothetical protein
MCVCSESAGCKACDAAKNGVYFLSMSILAVSVIQQMVLYGQTLIRLKEYSLTPAIEDSAPSYFLMPD